MDRFFIRVRPSDQRGWIFLHPREGFEDAYLIELYPETDLNQKLSRYPKSDFREIPSEDYLAISTASSEEDVVSAVEILLKKFSSLK